MVESIGQKTFISSAFAVAGQWISRLLGIISVVIFARVLSPDDYGIVAIAQLSFSFLQILLSDGSRAYLIRKPVVTDDDLDTAWTIRLTLVALIAIIIFITKDIISNFFNEPRLITILYYLSISFFISAFQNIGDIVYEKKLEYRKIFLFGFIVKLSGFIASICLALYIQNYWVLICGLIAMQITSVFMSYLLFEHRPRLTLCQVNEQWKFSKWIFLGNITSFIRNKLDRVLISKYLGTIELGFFNMSYHLSDMPYTEIIAPINKVVYSSYSQTLENKNNLAEMFLQVVGVMSIIIFPLYFGLVVLSKDIVLLLLGEKWDYVKTILPIVVFLLMSQTISLLATNILTALGEVKILALLNWVMVLIMVPVLVYIISYNDLYLFILGRALLAASFVPVFYLILFRSLVVNKTLFMMAIIRPLVAAAIMGSSVYFSYSLLSSLPIVISLLTEIIIGAIIYSVSLIALWVFSGKSLGGEEYIMDKIYLVCSKNIFFRKYFSEGIRKLKK